MKVWVGKQWAGSVPRQNKQSGELKDKAGDILYPFIVSKLNEKTNTNNKLILLTNKYCLFIQSLIHLISSCHRPSLLSTNTSVSHIIAPSDTVLHYYEHGRCKVFYVNPVPDAVNIH